MRLFSGRQQLTITQRLGDDWQDLADYFDIPASRQRRLQSGREAQDVWK